jgi:hypothetical protein
MVWARLRIPASCWSLESMDALRDRTWAHDTRRRGHHMFVTKRA